MPKQKPYFERIPVAIVKKIVERLPQEEKPSEWRDLAQQVQRETDSDKMIHLVQRLIQKYDEEKLQKARPAHGASDQVVSRL